MNYPAIKYDLDGEDLSHADNTRYRNKLRWTVTVIDRNPLSGIPNKVAKLPYSSFDRRFPADNLHHSVFTLYF